MAPPITHTPGPWLVKERMVYAENGDGATIATMASIASKADGKLIAAAPELLAALENLLAGPNWPGAQMTARAAIAKAKGSA